MLNRAGLTTHPAATHIDDDVEFTRGLGDLKRRSRDHAMHFIEKVRLDFFLVNREIPRSGTQKYAGR